MLENPPDYDLSSLPDQPRQSVAPVFDPSLLPDKPDPASQVRDQGGPTASSDPAAYPRQQWGNERFADRVPEIANKNCPGIPPFNAIDAFKRLITSQNSFEGAPGIPPFNTVEALRRLIGPQNSLEGAEAGVERGAAGGDTASQYGAAYAIKLFESFLMNLDNGAGKQDPLAVQARDFTNRMLDEKTRSLLAANDSVPPEAGLALDENRNRDTAPAPTADSPQEAALKNLPSDETNTSKNINERKDVLDSNAEPDQQRVTEVLTFAPVGHLRSSFGHTAININGTTYAFTEKGWNEPKPTAEYLKKNDFRDAVGQELDLTPREQDLLVKMIEQDMAEKPKWSSQNSCVTKIRDALEQATGRMFGFRPQPAIISPLDFRDNLDRFGYVIKKNRYPHTCLDSTIVPDYLLGP